jgi:hypothetical protein
MERDSQASNNSFERVFELQYSTYSLSDQNHITCTVTYSNDSTSLATILPHLIRLPCVQRFTVSQFTHSTTARDALHTNRYYETRLLSIPMGCSLR